MRISRVAYTFLASSIVCAASYAQPHFLTLPFVDPEVEISDGWIYEKPGLFFCEEVGNRCHKGIDYSHRTGSTFNVVAAGPGVAIASFSDTYGYFVFIRHDEFDSTGAHYFTLSAHIAQDTWTVPFRNLDLVKSDISSGDLSEWEEVERGDLVAQAGQTGIGQGIHLHFEAQVGGYAVKKTDPYDIRSTRVNYPEPCGPDYFWTECPPVPVDFWVRTSGLDRSDSVNVTFAISAADEIFAVTGKSCQDTQALGVFRSSDRGESWTPITSGLATTNMGTVAIAPSGRVFVGARDGVYRLRMDGESWESTSLRGVYATVLLATPEALYAADSCFCKGLFRSTDEGATWTRLDTGLPTCINALLQHRSGDLYAGTGTNGVYRLPFQGTVWQPFNAGLSAPGVRTLAQNAAGDLFVGTVSGGVFRVRENEGEWRPMNSGLPTKCIETLVVGPTEEVFAGTCVDGVYISRDNGGTWVETNSGITNRPKTVEVFAFDSDGVAYTALAGTVYRSR